MGSFIVKHHCNNLIKRLNRYESKIHIWINGLLHGDFRIIVDEIQSEKNDIKA